MDIVRYTYKDLYLKQQLCRAKPDNYTVIIMF